MIEGEAPKGFIRSDEAIPFTITRGNTTVVTATDVAADDPASFYIDKKCKERRSTVLKILSLQSIITMGIMTHHPSLLMPQKHG